MACVLGGTFRRGTDDGPSDERPAAEIFVQSFFMDLREVTVAQYRECQAARRCRRLMPFRGYMGDDQPVVATSWFDATGYCEWRGKRLPTEAEFERAASGPATTRYAWGNEPGGEEGCEHAVVETSRGKGCGRGTTWPVGSHAAGHWGLYDTSGNVWEWVQDWYTPCYRGCERECGDECFGENPRGPCGGAAECPGRLLRVVRGGSWWYPIDRARAQTRRGVPPANDRGPHRFGFRCAQDLP